jgi:hypothetical protein
VIVVRKPDYNNGGFEERVAPEAIVQGFLDWLLTTRRWQEDPEYFERKFRTFRKDVWEQATPIPVADEDDEEVVVAPPPPLAAQPKRTGPKVKA